MSDPGDSTKRGTHTSTHNEDESACPRCAASITDNPRLLDDRHLAEISALESFRPGLKRNMLDLFIHSTGASMDECRTAAHAADAEALTHVAHRIKGNAASLGAPRLKALAAKIESQASNRDHPAAWPGMVEKLAATLSETIAGYRQWLEQ